MNMDKKQQHLDHVEQAIQTAVAEDRIILPLLAQRQRFEEDDCLHYCLNHNVYAMKHKRMCGALKNIEMGHLGSRVQEQEKIELMHEAARPVKEAQTPPEKAPKEIPGCIPEHRQNTPPNLNVLSR
uniref:Uncharacterized protein n=1 Tax=Knipowitschia caucasica TaxID=637954 RepID=A0AAV2MPJ8_KNICA